MSFKTRRVLFFALFILFVLLGSLVLVYSLGIKISFPNLSFKETGGIYIKSQPSDALIFLNNQPIKNQSGFLQSGTFINKLEKGSYKLTLKKEGYSVWSKNVNVEPSLVKIFDSIVLIAQKDPEWLAEPAANFYVTNKGLVVERDGQVTLGENKIIGNRVEMVANDDLITYRKENNSYYLVNLSSFDSALNINLLFNHLKESRLGLEGSVPLVKVAFSPINQKKLIIQSQKALYYLDVAKLTITQIKEGINGFNLKGQQLVFYDQKSIYKHNLILKTTTKLAEFNEPPGISVKKIEIDPAGGVILLENNGRLSFLRNENERFIISAKADIVSLSNDGKLVAFTNHDDSIYVYQLEKKEYLQLKTGIPAKIEEIDWYQDNKHLLVKTTTNLYFVEVDSGLPLNVVKLADAVAIFRYDHKRNHLYLGLPTGIYKMEIW